MELVQTFASECLTRPLTRLIPFVCKYLADRIQNTRFFRAANYIRRICQKCRYGISRMRLVAKN